MVGAQSTSSVDSGARRPHVAGAKDHFLHHNDTESNNSNISNKNINMYSNDNINIINIQRCQEL